MIERVIDTAVVASLIFFAAVLTGAHATSFDDLWLTRVKPPPYDGVATLFGDRIGAWGNRFDPNKAFICAHLLEQRGQRLRVTNIANGKSTICEVQDRGPDRHKKYWPRRELDMTQPVDRAIGCDGMCLVIIERVPQ